MQQQKNLLLFFVLSFSLFLGWTTLQNTIWPTVKRPRPVFLPDERYWTGIPAQTQATVAQSVALPGLGGACQLVGQFAIAEWSADKKQRWVQATPEAKPKPPIEVPKPKPLGPVRVVKLGDETTFNLLVTFTSRGGGVQEIVLNKFEEATRLGLPAEPPQPLRLVPKDQLNPSHLLLHYAEAKDSHPVDTLAQQSWTIQSVKNGPDDEVHEIVLTADVPGLDVTITKTFSLARGDYHLGLAVQMERKAGATDSLAFRYQMTGAHGLPIEGEWFTYTYRNSLVGLIDPTRREAWRDMEEGRTIGVQEGGKEILREANKYIGYAGVVNQYFASMIVVDNQQAAGIKKDFLAWARPTVEGIQHPQNPQLDDFTTRVISETLDLRAGMKVEHRYLLYNGPVKVLLLGYLSGDKAVSPDLVHRYENTLYLNTLTDYHSPNAVSAFFSKIGWTSLLILCTNLMHALLNLLHHVVPIYGVCIILLTVVVRGTMFPLSRKQTIASAKMQAKMAELAPEVKKLEEKYRNDPMELQKEKNQLYIKRGINPLTMMGSCWMVFLQMPIFLGLYYALQESIFFRLEPFLWIRNLAAPDMLFHWGNVPLIGGLLGPFFNILPIFAVGLMIVHQKLTMPPPTDEQTAMQHSMMKYMMVFMGFMFYKVAAGLCIYFIASSLWGLAERKLLPKKDAAAASLASAPTAPKGKSGQSAPRSRAKNASSNGDGFLDRLREWWADILKQASKK